MQNCGTPCADSDFLQRFGFQLMETEEIPAICVWSQDFSYAYVNKLFKLQFKRPNPCEIGTYEDLTIGARKNVLGH
jgi:hypothetical protein